MIELMIVLAIIGILASIVIPVFMEKHGTQEQIEYVEPGPSNKMSDIVKGR